MAMLVITKYRPVVPFSQIAALLDKISALRSRITNNDHEKSPSRVYFNEASSELIILTQIDNFAAIDKIESDVENNSIGAEILDAGFIPHSVEYWRKIPGHLSHLKSCV